MGKTEPVTKEDLKKMFKSIAKPPPEEVKKQMAKAGHVTVVAAVRYDIRGIEILDVWDVYKKPEEDGNE